jgi:hypothetical protein
LIILLTVGAIEDLSEKARQAGLYDVSFMGEKRSPETVLSRREDSGIPIRGRERAIAASSA